MASCNDRHILQCNDVKVQVGLNGEKVTSLQAKSTLTLEYFVTLKKVTKYYSSIVTCYFYSVTGQV